MPKLMKAIDLYCGAGGTTTGAMQSGRVRVTHAINHWRPAIYSHQNNHPGTKHLCTTIERVNPTEFANCGIEMILASPECIHHSIARGGRPMCDGLRQSGQGDLRGTCCVKGDEQ